MPAMLTASKGNQTLLVQEGPRSCEELGDGGTNGAQSRAGRAQCFGAFFLCLWDQGHTKSSWAEWVDLLAGMSDFFEVDLEEDLVPCLWECFLTRPCGVVDSLALKSDSAAGGTFLADSGQCTEQILIRLQP